MKLRYLASIVALMVCGSPCFAEGNDSGQNKEDAEQVVVAFLEELIGDFRQFVGDFLCYVDATFDELIATMTADGLDAVDIIAKADKGDAEAEKLIEEYLLRIKPKLDALAAKCGLDPEDKE